jgi:two-component system, NarL family, invasion response regulator UvrY
MRPVTVLTVDDQAVFRRVARKLVAATPGFQQVGEAGSGERGLELADELQPDVVLVNVRMPGMDGVETARRLTRAHPDSVVVLVSLEEGPELPAAISSAGAAAHLRKQNLSTKALREIWEAHGRRPS